MRAREMMARLDRLPKRREGELKIPDFSLLPPEKQDRATELLKLIVASDDARRLQHSRADAHSGPPRSDMSVRPGR